ncbi:hypothetical protein IV38_GL000441 [Lactobacillus selangorensis]|uniref:Uncharacterized protein n=1 Tax=Lactobacillus selangorensis TaxID=81857 RepID=A0A0R2G226_9LACO|nr:hypothetical protein IV38_GL000441 [Lactobacillus selangorensis]KRN33915.1 hypothetical protein IV40_GL000227 [Lactobacillus selangorensis]
MKLCNSKAQNEIGHLMIGAISNKNNHKNIITSEHILNPICFFKFKMILKVK